MKTNTKEIKELASKIQADAFDLRMASSQFFMHVAVGALTQIEDALEKLESEL